MPTVAELNIKADRRFSTAKTRTFAAGFEQDGGLLPPGKKVSVEPFGSKVAEEGEYSIRVITHNTERSEARNVVNNARVVVFTCMDARVAQPVVQKIIADYKLKEQVITEQEIAVIAVGGGPVQPGKEEKELYRDVDRTEINPDTLVQRRSAVTGMFKWLLAEKTLGLEEGTAKPLDQIYLVAHTSGLTGGEHDEPCGGITHFGLKKPINKAVALNRRDAVILRHAVDEIPELRNMAAQQLELAATMDALAESRDNLLMKGADNHRFTYEVLRGMTKALVVAPQPGKSGADRLIPYPVDIDTKGSRLVELIRR